MLKALGWSCLVIGGMLSVMQGLGIKIEVVWTEVQVIPLLLGWAAIWIAAPEER